MYKNKCDYIQNACYLELKFLYTVVKSSFADHWDMANHLSDLLSIKKEFIDSSSNPSAQIFIFFIFFSSPVCNYYTFKNTSSPEQVGTCYLIQDYVEASSCDSCFSGIVNCIEN